MKMYNTWIEITKSRRGKFDKAYLYVLKQVEINKLSIIAKLTVWHTN